MRQKPTPELEMTVEDFQSFTETWPDEERWELIEGLPALGRRAAIPVNEIFRWPLAAKS